MDNLDILISQRLVERQRKLDIINNLSRKKKHSQKPRFTVKGAIRIIAAVAACLCIGWMVWPLLHNNKSVQFSSIEIAAPSFEEFRGAEANEVENLISQKEYQQALEIVDAQIAESQQELLELELMTQGEEREYLLSVEKENLSELLWSKIYILMQTENAADKRDEVKALVGEYLQLQPNQKHQAEAEKILKNF